MGKPKRFIITLVNSILHPWRRYIDGKLAYAVNDIPGGTIIIKRYQTYQFLFNSYPVDEQRYAFYLTTDPVGMDDGISLSISNDIMTIYIDEHYPSVFYYQDKYHKFIGGIVLVTDCIR